MIWKRNLDYRTEVYYQKSFNELKFIILGSPVIYFDFYTPNGDKIMKKLGKNLFLFQKNPLPVGVRRCLEMYNYVLR